MKSIIERIKKLLSLATSDNQNEAELASKKAQELLIKHNLEKADIKTDEPDYIEDIEDRERKTPEDKFIYPILCEYFFVYTYTVVRRRGRTNQQVIVGSPENVEIAKYVHGFLTRAFRDLYKKENKAQGWKGKFRSDYYFGLYKGLKEQLEAQRKSIDTEGALVPINEALVKFVKSQHNIREQSNRVNGRNTDARDAGQEAGRNLKISRGLNTSGGNTGLALGGK